MGLVWIEGLVWGTRLTQSPSPKTQMPKTRFTWTSKPLMVLELDIMFVHILKKFSLPVILTRLHLDSTTKTTKIYTHLLPLVTFLGVYWTRRNSQLDDSDLCRRSRHWWWLGPSKEEDDYNQCVHSSISRDGPITFNRWFVR